ncbi:MAG: hypothetical protein C0449_21490 [Polaromonas sp.]|nr:hypothetical protein [Polaromonas sp.]
MAGAWVVTIVIAARTTVGGCPVSAVAFGFLAASLFAFARVTVAPGVLLALFAFPPGILIAIPLSLPAGAVTFSLPALAVTFINPVFALPALTVGVPPLGRRRRHRVDGVGARRVHDARLVSALVGGRVVVIRVARRDTTRGQQGQGSQCQCACEK